MVMDQEEKEGGATKDLAGTKAAKGRVAPIVSGAL